MIVVDASVVFHIIIDGNEAVTAIQTLKPLGELVAPQLIDLEILNALRKQRQLLKTSKERIEQAFADFNAMVIDRCTTHHLNSRIWSLCQNLTPYDACYVALAESLDVPLYTRDRRMLNAPLNRAKIILI
jgi:predicted nucleic acid-binding protein